jgi:hypothetical protein
MNDDDRGFSPWLNHAATATPDDCIFGRGRLVRFFSGGAGRGGRAFGAIGAGGLFSFATGAGRAAGFSSRAAGLGGRAAGLGGFTRLSFDAAEGFADFFGGALRRLGAFLAAALFAAAVFFPCTLAIRILD